MEGCFRLRVLTISMILLVAGARAEESPTALKQCRIDLNTYTKLGPLTNPSFAQIKAQKDYLRAFRLSEISQRFKEMGDCMEADPQNELGYAHVSSLLPSARNEPICELSASPRLMEPVCRRGCAREEINHLAKSHRATHKWLLQAELRQTTGLRLLIRTT